MTANKTLVKAIRAWRAENPEATIEDYRRAEFKNLLPYTPSRVSRAWDKAGEGA